MTFEVIFLRGVIRAKQEGPIPWPPEPARLFAALVNAWGVSGSDPDEREALVQLEQTGPPAIYAPPLCQLGAHTVFVPPNELSKPRSPRKQERPSGEEKTSQKSSRSKKGQGSSGSPQKKGGDSPRPKAHLVVSTAAILGEPVVRFSLKERLEEGLLDRLRDLASRVGRLGSSHNPVLLRLLDEVHEAEGLEKWVPIEEPEREAEGVRLRTWYPGYLEGLCQRHRMVHGLISQPTGSRGEVAASRTGFSLSALKKGYRKVVAHEPPPSPPYELSSQGVFSLKPRLPLVWWSAMVRQLLPLPPCVHLVPLAFVGRRYADGRVLGLGVVLRRECGEAQAANVLDDVLERLEKEGRVLLGGMVEVLLEPPPSYYLSLPEALNPRRWMGPASRWATVLPAFLPQGMASLEGVIRSISQQLGLAPGQEPALVAGPYPFLGGSPSVFDLEPFLPREWRGKVYHLRLEFSRPVYGPLLVGEDKEGGFGFLAPLSD